MVQGLIAVVASAAARFGHVPRRIAMHRDKFLSLTFTLVLLLLSISFVQSASSAGPPSCLVSNERTGVGVRSLQAAIDAAVSGDTLIVKGTCVGASLIGAAYDDSRILTLQGVSNKQFGVATLDGGGSNSPVLTVSSYLGPNVTINDLTIRNGGTEGIFCQGTITLTRTTVSDNGSLGISALDGVHCDITLTESTVTRNHGPGAYGNRMNLTLNHSTVRDNGGGVGGGRSGLNIVDSTVSGNRGCGVGLGDMAGALIINSTISGNSGCGVALGQYSYLSLMGSTVSGNSTSGSGGGINALEGSHVSVSDSIITGNRAALDGGGINVLVSNVSITHSTVSGNTAGRYGGGISVGSGGSDYAGWLSLEDSTVSGNTASSGGGIYVDVSSSDNISLTGTNTFTDNVPEDCVGVAGC
jgi:hypothetical protein